LAAARLRNSAKQPKTLDLVPLNGKDQGKTQHLIYKLEDGKLYILGARPLGGPPGAKVQGRPGDFSDEASNTLLVFAAQPTPEKEPVYSVAVATELPKLRFELPGVRPGELVHMPKDAWLFGGSYVLFNGFPGQPGITVFALSRTWIVQPYRKEFQPARKSLGTAELEGKFSNGAGISGKLRIFHSEIPDHHDLENVNPKEILDTGLAPLKQVPKSFVFELAYKGKAITIIMTGAPPDDVRPSMMAERIAATFRWEP
jgi:hypothetical protein